MINDPHAVAAAAAFVWLAVILHDLLVREGTATLARELESGALRRAGEKMGPIAAAGLAGAFAGNAMREAVRRYEAELLADIESELVRREGAAQRESVFHQRLTIDTSAWDDAVDQVREDLRRIHRRSEYREELRRFHRRVAADVLRGAPVDTGELRPSRRNRRLDTDEAFRLELRRFDVPLPCREWCLLEPNHAGPCTDARVGGCQYAHCFDLSDVEPGRPFALCDCGAALARTPDGSEIGVGAEHEVVEWHGCYICRPDDPQAAEEGCVVCAWEAHAARAAMLETLDLFAPTDGLAVPFDPDAVGPAWESVADPAPVPEWQAWWATVTFLRWREALAEHAEYRRGAMLHVAEWYVQPCPAEGCQLCRWLLCRHADREPTGCEPCLEEWHRHRVAMITESFRDDLAQVGPRAPDGVDPVLLLDGPLAGWIVGVRGVTFYETYTGQPFADLARITYRREGPAGAVARSLERQPAVTRYSAPTEQHGPGVEDRRSTQLPDGCVADVWDDDEGYVPCGAEVEDQGSLAFCPEHLARLRQ